MALLAKFKKYVSKVLPAAADFYLSKGVIAGKRFSDVSLGLGELTLADRCINVPVHDVCCFANPTSVFSGVRFVLREFRVAIFNLFHKRQRQLRGEQSDVYEYDRLPHELRVQLVHVWTDVLGDHTVHDPSGQINGIYEFMVKVMRKELGLFQLPNTTQRDSVFSEWFNGFLTQENPEIALSMVELACKGIKNFASNYEYRRLHNSADVARSAIKEINERFQEHGIGFQFTDGEIIRVDSQLIHAEVVKPALSLLRGVEFAGAQAEFLNAHEKY